MSYPVSFEADYVKRRSRLTTFFRLILAIPLLIWLYPWAFLGEAMILIAWFVIIVTGRFPASLYNIVAAFVRYITRVTTYVALVSDKYPSFGGSDDPEYPVRMHFERLEHYSRLKTLFRLILAIPIIIIRYVMTLLLEIGSLAAWFVIIITGRMPRGLFDVMVLANSFNARSDAYLTLLTETYPPFQDDQTRAAGVSAASS